MELNNLAFSFKLLVEICSFDKSPPFLLKFFFFGSMSFLLFMILYKHQRKKAKTNPLIIALTPTITQVKPANRIIFNKNKLF